METHTVSKAQFRLVLIVGARPNFMKAAPILEALAKFPAIDVSLVHTGQHYDANLSDVFFEELQIRRPDVHLHVGSGSHAQQSAEIMIKFEAYLEEQRTAGKPIDWVVVVGDVNSTLACSLVAAKLGVPVAHVEAGLRSGDRSMPEEINRIVTDSVASLLLCSEPAGVRNLLCEGQPIERVLLVGNVMIDTLRRFQAEALQRPTLESLGLLPGGYGVVTLHRPGNVDDPAWLQQLLESFRMIAEKLPLVFAVHPRTADRMRRLGLDAAMAGERLRLLPPQGYLDFLCLTAQAKLIATDSGGLQEEATALGVPCLTLRPNTERPITLEQGSSVLIGKDLQSLAEYVHAILEGDYPVKECPKLWDGRAGERIAAALAVAIGALPAVADPRLHRIAA